jgi:hypothetical protein
MGHSPGVLVLTDPADQSVSFAARPTTAAWRSSTSKQMLRRPSSLAIAVGDPGSWSGPTKRASSTPARPSGGHSMTISVRRDPDDRVDELALHEGAALDLETQVGEKRRHRVEVGDGDSDVVELPDV